MDIKPGHFYFIQDRYFTDFPSDRIPQNKKHDTQNSGYRPFFCAFEDKLDKDIYWFVPVTSKIEKYSIIAAKKQAKYGDCITIRFGRIMGSISAFLIQNMIPVSRNYLVGEYIDKNSGFPVRTSDKTTKDVIYKSKEVFRLHRRGMGVILPDVDIIKKCLANQQFQKSSIDSLIAGAQERSGPIGTSNVPHSVHKNTPSRNGKTRDLR